MPVSQVLLIVVIGWFAVVAYGWLVVVPWLRRGPGRDPVNGLIWRIVKIYCRGMHRVTFSGTERVPAIDEGRDGLVVVSNHTGAVDPLLIQAHCPFLIRWMMAADEMRAGLSWLWKRDYVIPVNRDGNDSGPLRDAIRRVRRGQVVGIFPEGRITMPPREIRPFLNGVGVLVSRTKAPVLLAWVSGTPETNIFGVALSTRSHAHVAFVEVVDYGDERNPDVIARDLRRRLHEASGWPYNDEQLPPGGERDDD